MNPEKIKKESIESKPVENTEGESRLSQAKREALKKIRMALRATLIVGIGAAGSYGTMKYFKEPTPQQHYDRVVSGQAEIIAETKKKREAELAEVEKKLRQDESNLDLYTKRLRLINEISGLERLHQELEKEIIEVQNIRQIRQTFIKQGRDFWIPKRDGDIESNIIKKVEEVAKSSGLKLQNIGNAKPTKMNEDISFLEINIEAKASMEEISRFIAELYKANPCFYWRKCVLRPFNPRDAKDIVLSGTLNVVSLTGDNVAKVLMGEEK